MTEHALYAHLNNLVAGSDRDAEARALAALFRAETCIVFVRDEEVGQLLPAPRFPQTLAEWKVWRELLGASVRDGQCTRVLPYPTASDRCPALGLARNNDTVCVLLGVADGAVQACQPQLESLRQLLPLLGAALAGERAIADARAHAALAHSVAEDSRALARVLDDARRDLQEALAEAEAQKLRVLVQSAELDAIVRALPDALVVYAPDGRMVRANKPAQDLYGEISDRVQQETTYDGDHWTWDIAHVLWPQRTYHTQTPDGDQAETTERHSIVWQALHGQAAMDHIVLPRRNGTAPERHLVAHAAPITTSDGSPAGAVLVVTDVSMLYALEQHKEVFLSIVAHELRTPLTTLRIHSQLFRRHLQNASPAFTRAAERMETAVQRMDRLVSDLFDTSRIQSGHLELVCAPCDLAHLCMQASEDQQAMSGQTINFRVERTETPPQVYGDADRLTQVLDNLLANAVKYSPSHLPITVQLMCANGYARVAVHDEGPGMPPHISSRVFERFFRDPATPISQGSHIGLGLGLYISREIVERHGGTIGVESAPGHGSTFWFTLPLIQARDDGDAPRD